MVKITLALLVLFSCNGFSSGFPNFYPNKRIEISDQQISVDGQVSNLACPHKDSMKPFSSIHFGKTVLELSCYDEYLGGINIEKEPVASRDGDAGDSWQMISVLFRQSNSDQVFLRQDRYSVTDFSIDCTGETEEQMKAKGLSESYIQKCHDPKHMYDCKHTTKTKVWSSKTKTFSDHKMAGNGPKNSFQPFELYAKNCQ